MNPGRALRAWRKSKGLSLRAFAALVSEARGQTVQANTCSSWECNPIIGPEMRAALLKIGVPSEIVGAAVELVRKPKKPRPPRARPRAMTIYARDLQAAVKRDRADVGPSVRRLPLLRSECAPMPRPCPYISCKYHLFLDVVRGGSLKLNFPELLDEDGTIKFHEMSDTCALDVVERGAQNLRSVAARMNMTRQRVQQIEDLVAPQLREQLKDFQPGRGVRRPDLRRDGW